MGSGRQAESSVRQKYFCLCSQGQGKQLAECQASRYDAQLVQNGSRLTDLGCCCLNGGYCGLAGLHTCQNGQSSSGDSPVDQSDTPQYVC